ncbi:MAG: ParB/RepB/Spo0J family partition protein [Flavobacteriales bacterium]|nr:ParB/RepB/Spo0J family partition protein [Flavobacteriales bacterium]
MVMAAKKRALGRGLSALLEDAGTDITSKSNVSEGATLGSVSMLPISQIEANPFQPRTKFEKEALVELANSIQEHGIIQPITLRKLGYDKYQIISGERRFRASQAAGLKEIPAYIRVANDQSMLEMALVENIQRRELDAIEIAISYKRLLDECDLTQDALSQKVSKSRSSVTNYLRLLKLPIDVQLAVRDGEISMGHARALIGLEEKKQLSIFKRIITESLSVRQVEDLVRGGEQKKSAKPKIIRGELSFEQQKLRDDLSDMFGNKISIKKDADGKGKLEIPFNSDEDLNRLAEFFNL